MASPTKKLRMADIYKMANASTNTDDEPRLAGRRHIRPVERQRMRPWLIDHLDKNDIPGLVWKNRKDKQFRISWKHAANQGFSMEKDTNLFERWAIHTGRHCDSDHKRWKANFRCALNSLPDVMEMKNAGIKKGSNAFKVYRFLDDRETKLITCKAIAKKKRAVEATATKVEEVSETEEDELLKKQNSERTDHNYADYVSDDGTQTPSLPLLDELRPPSGVDLLLQADSKDRVRTEILQSYADTTITPKILFPLVSKPGLSLLKLGDSDAGAGIVSWAKQVTASTSFTDSNKMALQNVSISLLHQLGEDSKRLLDVRRKSLKEPGSSSQTYVYLCKWCEKVFEDKSKLFRHFILAHQEKLCIKGKSSGMMTATSEEEPTKLDQLQQEIATLEKKVFGIDSSCMQAQEAETVIEDGEVSDPCMITNLTRKDIYTDMALDLSVKKEEILPMKQEEALDLTTKGTHRKKVKGLALTTKPLKRRKHGALDIDYTVKFGNYGIAGKPRTKRQMSLHERKKEEEKNSRKVVHDDSSADAAHHRSQEDFLHAEILMSLKSGKSVGSQPSSGDESLKGAGKAASSGGRKRKLISVKGKGYGTKPSKKAKLPTMSRTRFKISEKVKNPNLADLSVEDEMAEEIPYVEKVRKYLSNLDIVIDSVARNRDSRTKSNNSAIDIKTETSDEVDQLNFCNSMNLIRLDKLFDGNEDYNDTQSVSHLKKTEKVLVCRSGSGKEKNSEAWPTAVIPGVQDNFIFLLKLVEESVKTIPYKCCVCGSKRPTDTSMVKHLRSHVSVSFFKCGFCGKTYSDEVTLDKHVDVHNVKCAIVWCEECDVLMSVEDYKFHEGTSEHKQKIAEHKKEQNGKELARFFASQEAGEFDNVHDKKPTGLHNETYEHDEHVRSFEESDKECFTDSLPKCVKEENANVDYTLLNVKPNDAPVHEQNNDKHDKEDSKIDSGLTVKVNIDSESPAKEDEKDERLDKETASDGSLSLADSDGSSADKSVSNLINTVAVLPVNIVKGNTDYTNISEMKTAVGSVDVSKCTEEMDTENDNVGRTTKKAEHLLFFPTQGNESNQQQNVKVFFRLGQLIGVDDNNTEKGATIKMGLQGVSPGPCKVCHEGTDAGKNLGTTAGEHVEDCFSSRVQDDCYICGESIAKAEFQQHKQDHYSSDYCYICHSRQTDLHRHHCRSHRNIRAFICNMCDRPFYSRTHLADHVVIHLRPRPDMTKHISCNQVVELLRKSQPQHFSTCRTNIPFPQEPPEYFAENLDHTKNAIRKGKIRRSKNKTATKKATNTNVETLDNTGQGISTDMRETALKSTKTSETPVKLEVPSNLFMDKATGTLITLQVLPGTSKSSVVLLQPNSSSWQPSAPPSMEELSKMVWMPVVPQGGFQNPPASVSPVSVPSVSPITSTVESHSSVADRSTSDISGGLVEAAGSTNHANMTGFKSAEAGFGQSSSIGTTTTTILTSSLPSFMTGATTHKVGNLAGSLVSSVPSVVPIALVSCSEQTSTTMSGSVTVSKLTAPVTPTTNALLTTSPLLLQSIQQYLQQSGINSAVSGPPAITSNVSDSSSPYTLTFSSQSAPAGVQRMPIVGSSLASATTTTTNSSGVAVSICNLQNANTTLPVLSAQSSFSVPRTTASIFPVSSEISSPSPSGLPFVVQTPQRPIVATVALPHQTYQTVSHLLNQPVRLPQPSHMNTSGTIRQTFPTVTRTDSIKSRTTSESIHSPSVALSLTVIPTPVSLTSAHNSSSLQQNMTLTSSSTSGQVDSKVSMNLTQGQVTGSQSLPQQNITPGQVTGSQCMSQQNITRGQVTGSQSMPQQNITQGPVTGSQSMPQQNITPGQIKGSQCMSQQNITQGQVTGSQSMPQQNITPGQITGSQSMPQQNITPGQVTGSQSMPQQNITPGQITGSQCMSQQNITPGQITGSQSMPQQNITQGQVTGSQSMPQQNITLGQITGSQSMSQQNITRGQVTGSQSMPQQNITQGQVTGSQSMPQQNISLPLQITKDSVEKLQEFLSSPTMENLRKIPNWIQILAQNKFSISAEAEATSSSSSVPRLTVPPLDSNSQLPLVSRASSNIAGNVAPRAGNVAPRAKPVHIAPKEPATLTTIAASPTSVGNIVFVPNVVTGPQAVKQVIPIAGPAVPPCSIVRSDIGQVPAIANMTQFLNYKLNFPIENQPAPQGIKMPVSAGANHIQVATTQIVLPMTQVALGTRQLPMLSNCSTQLPVGVPQIPFGSTQITRNVNQLPMGANKLPVGTTLLPVDNTQIVSAVGVASNLSALQSNINTSQLRDMRIVTVPQANSNVSGLQPSFNITEKQTLSVPEAIMSNQVNQLSHQMSVIKTETPTPTAINTEQKLTIESDIPNIQPATVSALLAKLMKPQSVGGDASGQPLSTDVMSVPAQFVLTNAPVTDNGGPGYGIHAPTLNLTFKLEVPKLEVPKLEVHLPKLEVPKLEVPNSCTEASTISTNPNTVKKKFTGINVSRVPVDKVCTIKQEGETRSCKSVIYCKACRKYFPSSESDTHNCSFPKTAKCPYCQLYVRINTFEHHIEMHKKPHAHPFVCLKCKGRFTLECDVIQHILNHFPTEQEKRPLMRFCRRCNKKLGKSRTIYFQHLQEVHAETVCRVCLKVVATDQTSDEMLKAHIKTHYTTVDFLDNSCEKCLNCFASNDLLQQHVCQPALHDTPFSGNCVCDACHLSFVSQEILSRHTCLLSRETKKQLNDNADGSQVNFENETNLVQCTAEGLEEGNLWTSESNTEPVKLCSVGDEGKIDTGAVQNGTNRFRCRICNLRCCSHYQLRVHKLISHFHSGRTSYEQLKDRHYHRRMSYEAKAGSVCESLPGYVHPATGELHLGKRIRHRCEFCGMSYLSKAAKVYHTRTKHQDARTEWFATGLPDMAVNVKKGEDVLNENLTRVIESIESNAALWAGSENYRPAQICHSENMLPLRGGSKDSVVELTESGQEIFTQLPDTGNATSAICPEPDEQKASEINNYLVSTTTMGQLVTVPGSQFSASRLQSGSVSGSCLMVSDFLSSKSEVFNPNPNKPADSACGTGRLVRNRVNDAAATAPGSEFVSGKYSSFSSTETVVKLWTIGRRAKLKGKVKRVKPSSHYLTLQGRVKDRLREAIKPHTLVIDKAAMKETTYSDNDKNVDCESSLKQCCVCDQNLSLMSEREVKEHLKEHRDPVVCSVCCGTFDKVSTLKEHLLQKHGSRLFSCVDCGTSHLGKIQLDWHRQKVHGFASTIQQTKPKEMLEKQKRKKIYGCRICKKSFFKLMKLTKHVWEHDQLGSKPPAMETRTVIEPVQEDVTITQCSGRKSRSQSGESVGEGTEKLTGEIVGDGNYMCSLCKIAFLESTDLFQHAKVHLGVHEISGKIINRNRYAQSVTGDPSRVGAANVAEKMSRKGLDVTADMCVGQETSETCVCDICQKCIRVDSGSDVSTSVLNHKCYLD